MKIYHAAKLKLDISKQELMSMKASEVIASFSFSVAKHRRIAAAKNLVHRDTAVCIFLFKRKESELLFRNRFSSG